MFEHDDGAEQPSSLPAAPGDPRITSLQHQTHVPRSELLALRQALGVSRRQRRGWIAGLFLVAAAAPLAVSALPKRVTFQSGEPISAESFNANFEAVWDEVERLSETTAGIIEDTTLNVPDEYPSIHEALAALDGRFIHSDAVVTIRVSASGSPYLHTSSVTVTHPQGDRIRILGDEGHPENVRLLFEGARGFYLSGGRHLQAVSGFRIECGADSDIGVAVEEGSSLALGSLIVQGCSWTGILAYKGGSIDRWNKGSLLVAGCGAGASVGLHSVANLSGGRFGATEEKDGNGEGLWGAESSYLYCAGCETNGNTRRGLVLWSNSTAHVHGLVADGNGGDGLVASGSATVLAETGVRTTNNAGHGVHADDRAVIFADDVIATGNGFVGVGAYNGGVVRLYPGADVSGNTTNYAGTISRMDGVIDQR